MNKKIKFVLGVFKWNPTIDVFSLKSLLTFLISCLIQLYFNVNLGIYLSTFSKKMYLRQFHIFIWPHQVKRFIWMRQHPQCRLKAAGVSQEVKEKEKVLSALDGAQQPSLQLWQGLPWRCLPLDATDQSSHRSIKKEVVS